MHAYRVEMVTAHPACAHAVVPCCSNTDCSSHSLAVTAVVAVAEDNTEHDLPRTKVAYRIHSKPLPLNARAGSLGLGLLG